MSLIFKTARLQSEITWHNVYFALFHTTYPCWLLLEYVIFTCFRDCQCHGCVCMCRCGYFFLVSLSNKPPPTPADSLVPPVKKSHLRPWIQPAEKWWQCPIRPARNHQWTPLLLWWWAEWPELQSVEKNYVLIFNIQNHSLVLGFT